MSSPTRDQVHDAVYEALQPWMYPPEFAGDEEAAEEIEEAVPQVVDAVMALLAEAPQRSDSPERYSEYVFDLRSASRAVRSQSWPLEMGEWADKLADRLARYADEPPAAEAPQPEEPDELSDEEWGAFADAAGFGAEAPQPGVLPEDDAGRVDAAWIVSQAPWFIRARIGAGWRPVMHECIEPPQWNRDGDGTEALTDAEIGWFRGEVVIEDTETPEGPDAG